MGSADECLTRAFKVLSEAPLIDGHNDLAIELREQCLGRVGDADVDIHDLPQAHTDLNRLRAGRVGGLFWSAYVDCPKANYANDFSTEVHYDSLLETMQQVDIIYKLLEIYPDHLGLARTSSEVWDVFRSGRIASLIGVEGLHQIANSPAVLRNLHRLGVRYVTLTHNANNAFADSATSEPIHHGLSSEGVAMVREMNRIGMMVDLSHTSVETQKQVLAISKAPVVFTHSSCAALVETPRNSPDEVLDMLKANGGLYMVTFICKTVHATEPSLARVADHIQHVGERIGYEHVGIGSDFDGTSELPKGLEDVSKFPMLIAELLSRGVSEESVRNLAGLNVLRVMDAVEQVSSKLKAEKQGILHDMIVSPAQPGTWHQWIPPTTAK